MGRQVVSERDVVLHKAVMMRTAVGAEGLRITEGNDPKPDGYAQRLLKYIPAEVVAVYMFIAGLSEKASSTTQQAQILWFALAVGLIGTFLYLRNQKVTKSWQYAITLGALLIWVYSLGGPFKVQGLFYDPLWGAVLLPSYTFLVAFYKG